MEIDWFLRFFDFAGTLVFAISGAIAGARRRLDAYGLYVLAIVTALGGGMIRDVLLGHTPPRVLTDIVYLASASAGAFLVIAFNRFSARFENVLRIFDAIGLGIFTVIGTRLSMEAGVPWFTAIMLGIITGTGGGMLRDILSGEVPYVLQKEIYALAALAGSAAYVGWLLIPELPPSIGILVTASITTGIRLIAVYRNWHLPQFKEPPKSPDK